MFEDFFINSASEIRDLWNDQKVFHFLSNQQKPNCVIERSARFSCAGMRYAMKNKIPYVLEWKDHLLDYRFSLLKWLARKVERQKIKSADFIFVESQVLKDALVREGIDPSKIIITYNAVNPDEFVRIPDEGLRIRRECGITTDDFVVGYAGSYAFYHDSIRMILAAEELQRRGYLQVKWLLLGSGKDYQICRDAAEERGLLGKSVFMISRVPKEDVPSYLSAFDIAILPGSTEIICPIKVMEYMASETVVLVPDYPCNREVVSEECGLLFEPFSERSIADKIEELVLSPEAISTLGRKAREVVSKKFIWDRTYGVALEYVLEAVS